MERREFVKLGAMAAGAAVFPATSPRAEMQAPPVTITFMGLMAFVRWTQQKQWDVLLIDSDKLLNVHLLKHTATLSVAEPWLDLANSDTEIHDTSGKRYIWNITNHEITLLADGVPIGTPDVKTMSGLPEKDCPASAEEAKDIQFLAKLAHVCGTGKVTRALIEQPLAAGTRVPSRMRLTAGTLECARHSKANPKAVFRANRSYAKNFADMMNLQLAAGTVWTLRVRNFATGATRRVAVKANLAGTPPVIELKNSTALMHGGNPHAPVEHFAAYYEILATPPQYEPIPRYVKNCDGTAVKPKPPDPKSKPVLDPPVYCPPPEGEYP